MTRKDFSKKTCMECKQQGPQFRLGIFICDNPKSDQYQHILTTKHHICAYFEQVKINEN